MLPTIEAPVATTGRGTKQKGAMMGKTKKLTQTLPLRVDPATVENIETIISRGMAADRSAALRAGAAALAHKLVDDPHVYLVWAAASTLMGVFGSQASAEAWLRDVGATLHGDEWYHDETWYHIERRIPM